MQQSNPVNTETQYLSSNKAACFKETTAGWRREKEGEERGKETKGVNSKGKGIHLFLSFSALLSLEESDPEEHLSARGPQNFSVRNSHRFIPALARLSVSSSAVSSLRRMWQRTTTYPAISAQGAIQLLPPPSYTLQCHMCSNQRKLKCAQLGGFQLPAQTLFPRFPTSVHPEGA